MTTPGEIKPLIFFHDLAEMLASILFSHGTFVLPTSRSLKTPRDKYGAISYCLFRLLLTFSLVFTKRPHMYCLFSYRSSFVFILCRKTTKDSLAGCLSIWTGLQHFAGFVLSSTVSAISSPVHDWGEMAASYKSSYRSQAVMIWLFGWGFVVYFIRYSSFRHNTVLIQNKEP